MGSLSQWLGFRMVNGLTKSVGTLMGGPLLFKAVIQIRW